MQRTLITIVAAASLSQPGCTDGGCDIGCAQLISAHLDATPQQLPGAVITFCAQGTCESATLGPLDSSGGLTTTVGSCSRTDVIPAAGGGYAVTIDVCPPALHDRDTVSLKLVDSAANVVVDRSGTVELVDTHNCGHCKAIGSAL